MRRDEEGFLYFVGRKDEMIKTSGYRVSPTEIEEVVYDTGLVRDAVALGVDDARLGQHIVLVVSPRERPRSTPTRCSRELRRQLPLLHGARARRGPAALPRSPNGKFDRNLLRQELAAPMSDAARPIAAFGRDDCLRASAASRSTGSPSGSAARRSSPTTGGCSPSGSRCCGPRCRPTSSSATRSRPTRCRPWCST